MMGSKISVIDALFVLFFKTFHHKQILDEYVYWLQFIRWKHTHLISHYDNLF